MKAEPSPIATSDDVSRQTRIMVCWWIATQVIFALVMLALFGGLFAKLMR